jgi:post-segregation antitoxin (ccd killing protein)
MATTERVTVTLPKRLLEAVDHLERNRSRFVTLAVENELERRRREALMQSIRNPHPDALSLAEAGIASWTADLPDDEASLLDERLGTSVRWTEEAGWEKESD